MRNKIFNNQILNKQIQFSIDFGANILLNLLIFK